MVWWLTNRWLILVSIKKPSSFRGHMMKSHDHKSALLGNVTWPKYFRKCHMTKAFFSKGHMTKKSNILFLKVVTCEKKAGHMTKKANNKPVFVPQSGPKISFEVYEYLIVCCWPFGPLFWLFFGLKIPFLGDLPLLLLFFADFFG